MTGENKEEKEKRKRDRMKGRKNGRGEVPYRRQEEERKKVEIMCEENKKCSNGEGVETEEGRKEATVNEKKESRVSRKERINR